MNQKKYDLSDVSLQNFIESLMEIVESKDFHSGGHSRRVAKLCRYIAQIMEMDDEQVEFVYMAGLVHDVGKIGVPEELLLKSGAMTYTEYSVIQQHTQIGAELLRSVPGMEYLSDIILHHHERFDGKGYPDNLIGENIPLESRIIAVADTFDALTSRRIYRDAFSVEKALQVIEMDASNQFDEEVVRRLFQIQESDPKFLKDLIESRVKHPGDSASTRYKGT